MLRRIPLAFRAHIQSREFTTITSRSPDAVKVIEVGPRDGLQNEGNTIPLSTKLQLIERLADTGVSTIEAGSFVPAKWVPQVGMVLEKSATVYLTILLYSLL